MANGQRKEPREGTYPAVEWYLREIGWKYECGWLSDTRHPILLGVSQGDSHLLHSPYCSHYLFSVPLSCFLNTPNIYSFIKSCLGTINRRLSVFYIYSTTPILTHAGHTQMLNHWTMLSLQQWVRLACRKKRISIVYLLLPWQAPVSLHSTLASLRRTRCSQNGWRPPSFGSWSVLPLSSCQLVSLSSL